jgi:hypothetical protein
MKHLPYVAIALCLIAFGLLGIFSIGFPFLATGLVMLFLLPVRKSFDVLLPAIAAVWCFTFAFLLMAPLGCTATAGGRAVGVTICDGVFSDYVGGGGYNPPLLPALLLGLVGAVIAAVAVRTLARRRSPRRRRVIRT